MNAEPSPPALDLPADTTPVMAQYLAAKARQPDALLFFRMGDFYELFFEDAETAAKALSLTLTRRGRHDGQDIPMAGVPVHAADGYVARLIRLGHRVAICEQLEDPAEAKKRGSKAMVRRDVVRVITPGTLTEDGLLDARRANRLAAVAVRAGQAAVATVDLSTGEVECLACERQGLGGVLAAVAPSETLAPDRLFADEAVAAALKQAGGVVQPMAAALAEPGAALARILRLFGVATLEAYGDFGPAEVSALGLVAAYLETTQAGRLPRLAPPRRLAEAGFMAIDATTRASLEIDRPRREGGRETTLVGAVDRTLTAAGARALAARLSRPLTDVAAIGERLDALEALVERRDLRRQLRQSLKGAPDGARALSRLVLGRGGPRDLTALAALIEVAASLAERLKGGLEGLIPPPQRLAGLTRDLSPTLEVAALGTDLVRALVDAPPLSPRDGGFVAEGFDAALDEARRLRDHGREVMVEIEARAQALSGVPLKVRHNAVLGYFLETTARAAEALMQPPLNAHFIHRQTLANQVRFTTTELADLAARMAEAQHRALALELAVFEALRERAAGLAPELTAMAQALGELDADAGLAEWAEEVGATRPQVDDSTVLELEAGRHPVVEAAVIRDGGVFTPNGLCLDGDGQTAPRLALVTGPNMAGKSTYLRQTALLAVLAQAGCFVPARSLRLGIVDRLFSRVGADDDLARGRSTFMVEMVETAAILTQAGPRALVVLDEIGRGTATYDGLAIAWACVEALHETNRCRALFATHYHELAGLAGRLAHVGNLSLRAREWEGELVFLHEVVEGAADRSYGVQVARLAGLPPAVVARARQVLDRLESEGQAAAPLEGLPLFAAAAPPATQGVAEPSAVERALAEIDPDGLSPREAQAALYRLKDLL